MWDVVKDSRSLSSALKKPGDSSVNPVVQYSCERSERKKKIDARSSFLEMDLKSCIFFLSDVFMSDHYWTENQ